MSSALQFVRTLSGLTILLGCKPYSIASTDTVFAEVIALIKVNAAEEAILMVIEQTADTPSTKTSLHEVKALDVCPGDEVDNGEKTVLGMTASYSIRGGYAGQNPDGEFEIFVDDAYLVSFESFDSAFDYANMVYSRYDRVDLKSDAGEVLATFLDGNIQVDALQLLEQDDAAENGDDLDLLSQAATLVARKNEAVEHEADDMAGSPDAFLVTANGIEKGRFESLPEAKTFAIGLFGSDCYDHVFVQNAQCESFFVLES